MMVELSNTIVADVAMGTALRSEYETGLAEFKPIQLSFVHVKVEYAL